MQRGRPWRERERERERERKEEEEEEETPLPCEDEGGGGGGGFWQRGWKRRREPRHFFYRGRRWCGRKKIVEGCEFFYFMWVPLTGSGLGNLSGEVISTYRNGVDSIHCRRSKVAELFFPMFLARKLVKD
jgi:hypothetical protein